MTTTSAPAALSSYTKIMNRKRSWTPLQVDKGQLVLGSEATLKRCLALRTLELPVKEMLSQGLEKDLPNDPGVIPALRSNMADEDKHDLGLSYVVRAHGVDESAEREALTIRKAWLESPEHPILKTAILERSVFFVLLPFFISRDEQTHVCVHGMVAHDLGLKSTQNLNKLRRATVHWAMDLLGHSQNKYLNKDFWMRQSDALYNNGKAPELADTQRARMPSFFEASNINLPQYG